MLPTGLLAVLTGRRWYGCHSGTGRVEELSPDARIPVEVTLLTVQGARKWDRIPAAARLDLPHLFLAPSTARKK